MVTLPVIKKNVITHYLWQEYRVKTKEEHVRWFFWHLDTVRARICTIYGMVLVTRRASLCNVPARLSRKVIANICPPGAIPSHSNLRHASRKRDTCPRSAHCSDACVHRVWDPGRATNRCKHVLLWLKINRI